MKETLLQIADIEVRFGGVIALAGVSFDLTKGELLGLIGPNGAGKTTLLRVVTGVVVPQGGSVNLAGVELIRLPTHERVRRGLGMSQQLVRPFHSMTVAQNVTLAAGYAKTHSIWSALLKHNRKPERQVAMALLEQVGIADAADALPSTLPLGYLKRLEVARALALNPKVLLLDEPLAGLNQTEAARLANTLAQLNQNGMSIVLIEHNLGEVMRICTRLVMLDNGQCLASGLPSEVMANPRVRAAYLGLESVSA